MNDRLGGKRPKTLPRIASKYIQLEVLSYSFSRSQCEEFIFRASGLLRLLIIKEFELLKKLSIPEQPMNLTFLKVNDENIDVTNIRVAIYQILS